MNISNGDECYKYLQENGFTGPQIIEMTESGKSIQSIVERVQKAKIVVPKQFTEHSFDKTTIPKDARGEIFLAKAGEMLLEKIGTEAFGDDFVYANNGEDTYRSGIDCQVKCFNPSINVDAKSKRLNSGVVRDPIIWINDPFYMTRIKEDGWPVDEDSVRAHVKKYRDDPGYRDEVVRFVKEDVYSVFGVDSLTDDNTVLVKELGSITVKDFYDKASLIYRPDTRDDYHKAVWQFKLGGAKLTNMMNFKECVLLAEKQRQMC
jgi:hypothetical protein